MVSREPQSVYMDHSMVDDKDKLINGPVNASSRGYPGESEASSGDADCY